MPTPKPTPAVEGTMHAAKPQAKPKRDLSHLLKALPDDALACLRTQLKHKSQAQLAREMDVSPAAISSALNGKYIGDAERLAERIRGQYLKAEVTCPVLGPISLRICQDERAKPFAATNPQRVRLFKACQQCPHNPTRKEAP